MYVPLFEAFKKTIYVPTAIHSPKKFYDFSFKAVSILVTEKFGVQTQVVKSLCGFISKFTDLMKFFATP